MDRTVKEEADILFHELGMTTAGAVNIFIRQALREGKLPFTPQLNVPNADTIAAMLETKRLVNDPKAKRYDSVDELFADLDDSLGD